MFVGQRIIVTGFFVNMKDITSCWSLVNCNSCDILSFARVHHRNSINVRSSLRGHARKLEQGEGEEPHVC